MQTINYFDPNGAPILGALVASSAAEEQLLALFSDMDDSGKSLMLTLADQLTPDEVTH